MRHGGRQGDARACHGVVQADSREKSNLDAVCHARASMAWNSLLADWRSDRARVSKSKAKTGASLSFLSRINFQSVVSSHGDASTACLTKQEIET
jgi:hypothetical protein